MKVVDVTSPDVTLEWIAPTDTGNCPLSAYVIEARQHDDVTAGEFRQVGQVGGDVSIFTVTSLPMNASHDFRVRARNEEFEGEWCDTEAPVFVKKPIGKPVILLNLKYIMYNCITF